MEILDFKRTYFLPMESLVQILQRNAMIPHDDIARLLDLSVGQVEKRIAELEKEGIILGYQAIIK